MNLFVWQKQYETGIEAIDNQHRELFKRIDSLALSIYDGKGKTEVEKTLIFLQKYIDEHFELEESLMLDKGYPDYGKHVGQHRDFCEFFEEIVKEFEAKGVDSYMAIRIEKEVRGWWESHILKSDMKYAAFFG